MKKISGLIIFTILFLNIKSFGGNKFSFPADTAKKTVADSTKKTQDDSDTDDDHVRSYAIGLEFGSDQSYHGIHSGAKVPYMEPNFTYTAPSGFYVEASDQFVLLKDSGGFDAFAINPGWNIDLADNTTLNFNFTHYWFKAKTPLTIKSDLSDVVETYIDQSLGEWEGRFTIDYDYYKKTSLAKTPGDLILTPDIQHTFEIDLNKKSSLSFIPEGSIDFGTRNAYTHYVINKGDTVRTRKGQPRQVPSNTSFGTLDYSLVLSIDYKVGRFEVEPALNYNAALYTVQGISSKPLGYLTLDLTYTIEKKVSLSSHPKSKP